MKTILPQYIISEDASDTDGFATLIYSSVGSDPTSGIWSATSAYDEGDTVYYLDTSGVTNGCYVQYVALQDMHDNTGTGGTDDRGQNPETSPLYWSTLGAIDMYKMFDQYSNTVTTSSSNIIIRIKCSAITSIAFLNVQAKNITINGWNTTSWGSVAESNKIIDDAIIDLTQPLNDWYEYFFKDFSYTRDLANPLTIGGLYNNMILEIEFEKYADLDCSVGMVIPGREYVIGDLRYGVSTGIEDYSKKIFDETFGSHYIQEGNYRKLMECDLIIENSKLNIINSVITQLRARPTVWQGNDNGTAFDNLLIYGIPKSFNIVISNINLSECSLEIEGII